MLHILAKRHVRKLAHFANSNVLLAFDFDGTLAPIVPDPAGARMTASTRRLLAAVARRYPCVVISGRARGDLMKRIGPVPIFHVSGNHGVEPWGQDAAYPGRVQRWIRQLRPILAPYRGIMLEDKTYTLTIHYRHARPRRPAIAAITAALRGLRGVRVLGGKDAVNLIPREAPVKGAALERAWRLLACDTAIYVGDDQTDEDAFGAAGPDRLLAIRIGGRRDSRARYGLKTQTEIDRFLETLLTFRSEQSEVAR